MRSAPEFSAEVTDLAHDGRGVARIDGKVVFIADALPGETVTARRVRRGRDADEAQTLSVQQASPHRVAPRCAHFGVCGGCAMQHLAPAQQLAHKQKQLIEVLQRVGRMCPDEVAAPITGPVWGYRRRARLAVKHVPKKGGVLVGFRERLSPYVAELTRCEVLDARVGGLIPALRELITGLSIRARLPQIEVAIGAQVALVLRVLDPPSTEDRERLLAFAATHGLDLYLQSGGPDSVRPLSPLQALSYSPDGSELRLAFEPNDFIQINAEVSQQIVRRALEWLAPLDGARVLELFCGLGNFTLPLARAGAQVTAVEGEAALVARGRDNAERAGLAAEFLRSDLFQPDPQMAWLRQDYDAVLLDPPRAGAREVLPLVAARKPQRIVYVSCHPGTLARDAETLVGEFGYRLRRAGIADMFPHTAHVESMALFER